MDPVTVATDIWSVVGPMLPDTWQRALPLLAMAACGLAAIALQFWTPPAGSRWVWLWYLLTWLAAARGRNAPVSQPGVKSLAIPVDADRAALARQLGIDPAQANPRRLLAAPRPAGQATGPG